MLTGGHLAAVSDSHSDGLSKIVGQTDVASLILAPGKLDETAFQAGAAPLVAQAQQLGIAAIIADETRVAGRLNADGVQLGQDPNAIRDAVERYAPQMMVGAANVKSRHTALVIGELQPDYLMFGKPGGDTHEAVNPKNLDLGDWWSAMVEIPCIVLGGTSVESVVDVARCGADFVALEAAIFGPETDAINWQKSAEKMQQAHQLLEHHAPEFEAI